jgi:prepilin-type N-terminal cleavage/methylation domain-containing protein
MKNNLLLILNLLCISLFVTSLIILSKAPVIAVGCMIWAIFYFIKSNKHLMKIKAFTLIELVAVIAILGILISIIVSIRPDTVKRDAQYLNSLLMASQTYSYTNEGIHQFELPDNIYNEVDINKPIFFQKGTPVNSDGSMYLDCTVTVFDKYNTDNKYKITINSFTGKRSFYD